MKEKISVKTLYLLGIITIGLIGLGLGSTYAMFTASAEIDNPISISTNLNSEDDIIETIEVTVDSNRTKEIPITINNSSTSTLNYAVWYTPGNASIKVGTNLSNSDSSSPTGTITSNTTKKVYVQLKNTTSSTITITLGVSSNTTNVIISNSMTLVPNKELKDSLAETITKLYTNATKTTTTVNSVTYNLASSVGLMNDRKGSMSTDIDAGNIRYYGANPNNYIYFNCSDYNNQTSNTCETWRIIGVFDGKVKIMRGSQIGEYSWDSSARDINSGEGVNGWPQADLMKLLNGGYDSESVGGSLYWKAKSGTCYSDSSNSTKACDFTSTGLKNDITRNMIAETTYYTRGYNNSSIFVDAMYDKERVSGTVITGVTPTRTLTWTGKVAIPYPSDYGYAADLSLCKQTLTKYDNSTCTANNWMKGIITNNGSNSGWLLTPYSGFAYSAWIVLSPGRVYSSNFASYALGVAPVLSLTSELDIGSGTGTSSSPYQLSV